MNHLTLSRLFVPATLAAAALAQGPDFLVTYSQPEVTLSGSGGTNLRFLAPNEIAHLEWSAGPCSSLSAEKWAPRTCFHTMAGDENGDGTYWNPAIFGSIDALVATMSTTPIGGVNPRTVFYSLSAAMGTNISGIPGLRPGDVGRIVRTGVGDGQVEYFMRQEQFNQSLGLPLNTPIDVDAIAFSPNYGVFFSLDQDIVANTICGPMLIQDGAVIMVPAWALTYTPDFRIASVLPVSAAVLYTEAQIDAFVNNAQVTDRFGVCLTTGIDLESLEIDWGGPNVTVFPCGGAVLNAPSLIFSCETMTGASLLTTAGGGTIYSGLCGATGRGCGGGPTPGSQMGIQPTSAAVGAPSYVNGLLGTFTWRYTMEPQQHVQNVFPAGAPFGATSIEVGSPWLWNFVFIEIVPPTVPGSFPAFPFSLFCFPDIYVPSFTFYMPAAAPGGFGAFPMPAIPANWQGKVLFQSFAFGGSGIELSTPVVIDVQ